MKYFFNCISIILFSRLVFAQTDTTLVKKLNFVEPETHITNLRLFYEDVNWLDFAESIDEWYNLPINLVLPYNKNHLTFDFIAEGVKIPQKVLYQWKLEGFDYAWSPVMSYNFATYNNLPPGRYTFMVKACNEDGLWNKEPATFNFTIIPPYWQTWWFYSIFICIIIFFMAIGPIIVYFQVKRTNYNN